MADWFRSWHGAPTDNKWLLIARRAGVAPGIVSAVVWALLDHASAENERGDVSGFDVETYSVFSGFPEEQIQAVIDALVDKEIIVNGRLASWEKRQPKREDTGNPETGAKSAMERKREQRNRKRVTQCHDMSRNVTQCHDRVEESRVDITVVDINARAEGLSEIMRVGKQIAEITGWNNDPRWFGDYARVEVWLKGGWNPDLDIYPTISRIMASRRDKGQGAPSTMKYFEKAIADAYAQRLAPLPEGKHENHNQHAGQALGRAIHGNQELTGTGSASGRRSEAAKSFSELEEIKRERRQRATRIAKDQGLSGQSGPAVGDTGAVLCAPEQIRGKIGHDAGEGRGLPDGSGGVHDRQSGNGIPQVSHVRDISSDAGGHSSHSGPDNAATFERALSSVGTKGS